MKKLLAILLTVVLLFTSGTTVLAKNTKNTKNPNISTQSVATDLQYSEYKFVYDLPDYILSDKDTEVEVTYKTKTTGENGYEDIHFEFTASCLQAEDGTKDGNVTFEATDSDSNTYTFLNEGTWGPSTGFDLPADYDAATEWTLNFSEAGKYRITFQAVDSDDNVITEQSQDLIVKDAVFVYEIPEEIELDEYADVDVSFITNQQYEDVRFEFSAEGPDDVEFKAQDSDSTWYTFTNEGSWGTWFDISDDYEATTSWQIKFTEYGTYSITFKLVDEDEDVYASGSETIVIKDLTDSDDDEDDEDDDEDDEDENDGSGNTHGLLNALKNHLRERQNNANENSRIRSTQRLMELLQTRGLTEDEINDAVDLMEDTITSDVDCDDDDYKLLGKMHQLKGKKYATYINGQETEFDVPPMLQEGRTLVPFRKIAESLGAEVSWNAEERIVVVTKGDITVELKIDEKTALVNGTEVTLDVPAQVYKNRTMIPLRFLAEALDTTVDYYPEGSMIVIKKNDLK